MFTDEDVEVVGQRLGAWSAALRPSQPSTSSGRGYRLPDGTVLWLSEAEWWELMDRSAADEAWRKEQHDLLVAVGILRCRLEMVATIQRFDVSKQYRICPPTWDPFERRAVKGGRRRR